MIDIFLLITGAVITALCIFNSIVYIIKKVMTCYEEENRYESYQD